MLETKGFVLSDIIFECERPLLIEYKDCIALMPTLDLFVN